MELELVELGKRRPTLAEVAYLFLQPEDTPRGPVSEVHQPVVSRDDIARRAEPPARVAVALVRGPGVVGSGFVYRATRIGRGVTEHLSRGQRRPERDGELLGPAV